MKHFDLQIVEPEEVFEKTGLAYLHTSHCLGSGEIMISALGSPEGKAEGIGVYNDSNITSLEPTVGDYSLFPIKLYGLKRLTT